MYQLPLVGTGFEANNTSVYRKLKAYLIDGPGWAWIEPFDGREDGRAGGFSIEWAGRCSG